MMSVATEKHAVEITHEMIEAGADAIWAGLTGVGRGGGFSAHDFAIEVYRAMVAAKMR